MYCNELIIAHRIALQCVVDRPLEELLIALSFPALYIRENISIHRTPPPKNPRSRRIHGNSDTPFHGAERSGVSIYSAYGPGRVTASAAAYRRAIQHRRTSSPPISSASIKATVPPMDIPIIAAVEREAASPGVGLLVGVVVSADVVCVGRKEEGEDDEAKDSDDDEDVGGSGNIVDVGRPAPTFVSPEVLSGSIFAVEEVSGASVVDVKVDDVV
ncbi:hypothetical protein GGS26DRAFT_444622 [Hypomontagnella submonticulosa]|nr:hypothetical protein GGS26DRAFT_444622 [Hypomontagnella submonticulosa]